MTVAGYDREGRFDALFEAYLADMVAYCGWRTTSAADAQDAVSEVFLAAWRRIDDVPAGAEARLWLYGTARRVLANQSRAQRRQALLHTRLCSMPIPISTGPGNHADAASPELQVVREALSSLQEADREVLLLSEWEGFTSAEIGRMMRCSAVAARGRLFRARRRFRAALGKTGVELWESERDASSTGSAEPSSDGSEPGAGHAAPTACRVPADKSLNPSRAALSR